MPLRQIEPRPSRNKWVGQVYEVHYSRVFLNRPYFHSDASLLTQITIRGYDHGVEESIDFRMTDCNEHISLSFSTVEGHIENSLHKVDILLEELTKFRESLLLTEELRHKLELEHEEKAKLCSSTSTIESTNAT